MEEIKLKDGSKVRAELVRVYNAFEGGQRYIFKTAIREYRCVKDKNGNYIEYRP